MSTWVLPLNPQPWTAPNVARGGPHRGVTVYKNEELRSYQEAVKELLQQQGATIDLPAGEPIALTFFFWRRLDVLDRKGGRLARNHVADATNMQKATEDAIQGVLIDNDRDVTHVESWIVEQSETVEPRVAIMVGPASSPPARRLELLEGARAVALPSTDAPDYDEAEGMF